ncbi:Hypothetical protein NTJ_04545 [Nesidiocoris tenuis]|uniref:Uncharacterized protein n=1 Tax=Nesidiocoris tenuis TaxID=355587 RepID=A0ABN7AHK3_9HEMI|nr:Hypothetical protein NTJ_04545 [Nesidiocoris tenuis]
MAETRVADALTNCSKGICFRVAMTGNSSTTTKNVTSAKMIKSSQRRTTGKPNETIHLFCGFRSQERTLCQEIRAIATLLGDGMKVGHCSSCATDLCNGVSAFSTGNAFAGIGLLNFIKML